MIEQPGELGAGEVRVEEQASTLLHLVFVAGLAQLLAAGGRSPVLPHDRVVDRLTGGPIPQHRGLALVGDADRGDVRGREPGLVEGLAGGFDLSRPDLFRVVLDPAGLGKDLAKLLLAQAADVAARIEDDGT